MIGRKQLWKGIVVNCKKRSSTDIKRAKRNRKKVGSYTQTQNFH